jgi:hypothetical protein
MTISRKRFQHLLRLIHVMNKDTFVTDKSNPDYDPIGKIRWLLENLVKNFRVHFNPSEFICVDESMIQYNGRYCGFIQFMPLKPITHGLKVLALACSQSKFVFELDVYLWPALEPKTHPKYRGFKYSSGVGIVTRLTHGLDGHYYTVACDNAFTSPELFDDLLKRGIYGIGTVNLKRVGIPKSLDIPEDERRGTLYIRMHRDRRMSCVHWSDYKGVMFLSTKVDPVAPNTAVRHHSGQKKLEVPTSPMQILYSRNMHGVDVQDQLRGSYPAAIPTKKWWHQVYWFGVDTTLTNSFITYRTCCTATGIRPMSHADFQLSMAYSLMEWEAQPRVAACPIQSRPIHHSAHMRARRVCVARHNSNRTHYVCPACGDLPLCLEDCFVSYHVACNLL